MSTVHGFWETLDLLVGIECRRSNKDLINDVDDWVEKVIARKNINILEDEDILPSILTRFSDKSSSGYSSGIEEDVKKFFDELNLPPIECRFSHPQVKSKLEKLMGSNIVSLTDRSYMVKLQERILEDYAHCMGQRISVRQAEEMERVKYLVLTGKIPFDQAPPEMANHPVMLIEMYCRKLIAERRAKIKVPRPVIPKYLYWDDTPDPPSGLSIESGHVLRKCNDRLCIPPETFLSHTESEDIENGYMFTDEEYERMKYESPLIKELKGCETVEQMYALADEIIGILKTIDDKQALLPDGTDTSNII